MVFEEAELSDTVVEFRAYSSQSSSSKLSVVAGVLFVTFLLGSLCVRFGHSYDDMLRFSGSDMAPLIFIAHRYKYILHK